LTHHPIGLEGLDDILVENMRKKGLQVKNLDLLPEGDGWLLVEFGGDTQQEADDRANKLLADLKKHSHPPSMQTYEDPADAALVWKVRKSGRGATAHVPGENDFWPGWEDSAVAPEHVGSYLRELRALYDTFGYRGSVYGHFGDGCIHTRIDFDLKTKKGIEDYRKFIEKASDLVLKYNG